MCAYLSVWLSEGPFILQSVHVNDELLVRDARGIKTQSSTHTLLQLHAAPTPCEQQEILQTFSTQSGMNIQ